MFNAILLGIRFVILVLDGHQYVALENAALREQLAVLQKKCETAAVASTRPSVLDSVDECVDTMEVCSVDRPVTQTRILQ